MHCFKQGEALRIANRLKSVGSSVRAEWEMDHQHDASFHFINAGGFDEPAPGANHPEFVESIHVGIQGTGATIPQFKATAELGECLETRFSQSL